VGEWIGPYQLQSIAGRGGMGVVYRAYDTSLDRTVALKVLRKDRLSGDALGQLETEAAITAAINHPHVVKVFTTGTDHGRFYIAMELADKGTLDDLIHLQGRVAETQLLEIAIQVADGLRAAYHAGLIHRDVKPGNILFSDAHTAKIVDFGLAMLEQKAAEAAGSEIWGTPYYVAPEKLDQQPEDLRSDIYSLGATLFHALAGRPPFEAKDASMVALKHLKNQAVSLQAFAPWVSGSTAFVINRTLLKDPDERYQTYDELIEHLEYARNELVSHGGNPQEKKRIVLETEEDQRLWSYITFGMIGLAAVIGVGVFLYFHFHDKSGDRRKTLASAASGADSTHSAQYDTARRLLLAGKGEPAAEAFHALAQDSKTPAPLLQWCLVHEALGHLVGERPVEARSAFAELANHSYAANDPSGQRLSEFFNQLAKLAMTESPTTLAETRAFNKSDYTAIALFTLGLKDWANGQFDEAGSLLREFSSTSPGGESIWVGEYKSLAGDYVADFTDYREAAALLKRVKTPGDLNRVKNQVEKVKSDLRHGRKLAQYLDTMMNGPVDMSSAQLRSIESQRPQIASLCNSWSFDKAFETMKKMELTEADARRERVIVMRKIQWLVDFEKTLSADAAHGYPIPLKKADHFEIKDEIASLSDKGVLLKTGETVEWKKIMPEGVLNLAKAITIAEQNPQEKGRHAWLTGIYALSIGRKTDAEALLKEAATLRADCAEALPLVMPEDAKNLAIGSKVSASSRMKPEEDAANAIDGNSSTKWCSATSTPEWLQLDLGKTETITRWTVRHAHSGGEGTNLNTADFALQQSSDGKNWTNVDSVIGETSDVTSRAVAPVSTQYVRLFVTKPGQDNRSTRVYEFELYGPKDGTMPDLFAATQSASTPNLIGTTFGNNGKPSFSTVDDHAGLFTVIAGGNDIWGVADSFRFLSRRMTGNGELIAYVESVEKADQWSKSGLMFREGLTPDARCAFVYLSATQGASFQIRKETGGQTVSAIERGFSPPCWVKLVRDGDQFTAYAAADGVNWKRIGNQESVAMGAEASAGVAACSHNTHEVSTSKVSSVEVTGL